MTQLALSFSLLVFLVFAAVAPVVWSQCPEPPAVSELAPGEYGLFFDAAGTQRCYAGPLFVPAVDVYLVAGVPPAGIRFFNVWELIVDGLAVLSPHGSVIDTDYTHQFWLDSCGGALPAPGVTCPSDGKSVVALARYTMQAFGYGDVCFERLQCPTLAGTFPTEPFYETCSLQFETLALVEDSCLTIRDPAVAIESTSWSAVRGRF